MGILILMGTHNSAFFCCNLILMLMLSLAELSVQTDTINPSQPISDGESLVSEGEKFQLGFFSPGNSSRRYVGIWYYRKTQKIVWVANREGPLNDTSGVLKIGVDGNLILLNRTEKVVWSTNIHNTSSSQATIAQLLESGNLVLRGDRSKVGTEGYLWESFDHPSDTLLSGVKLGINPVTGLNQYLTSWKSADDPSPGEFLYGVDHRGLSQLVLRKGSVTKFRSGPWNGEQFDGIIVTPNLYFNPTVITNSEATYYEFFPSNEAPASMSILTYSGVVQRYVWNNSSLEWLVMHVLPSDPCDNYGHCGPNSICTIGNSQTCSCLAGYVPKSLQDWELQVWSGGCVRKHSLNCSRGEGFVKIKGVKMPDFLKFWINTTMTLKECEAECRRNCSCAAYANSNATGKEGSGCLLWYGDLVDIRTLAESNDQRLYIRVTASDLGSQNKKKVLVVVIMTASITLVGISIAFCVITRRRRRQPGPQSNISFKDVQDVDLPVFSLVTIEEATNKFSNSNKIGEGGFGPVYKGQLLTGQKIAVKRLSENSNQGLHEFKNEVILISKLQHRNLVRLLGCCIQGDERMLIYEYMPNGSLSSFLFDNRNSPLVWDMRFDIIVGIARGLLYLHRDSRLRIIHRDLKASNVLLDNEMNPKISDFGIARAFRGDQLREKTTRVVGTHGYMSPEYIIHGLFSMKSDVFSFGVLVLEIISGKKNREFYHPDHNLSLLGYAWKLWIEGNVSELVEEEIKNSFSISEVLKCVQVGLLCVQQHPEDRPTTSSVLLWLDSESVMLPQPKQPAFCSKKFTIDTELPWLENQHATNKLTLTLVEGR